MYNFYGYLGISKIVIGNTGCHTLLTTFSLEALGNAQDYPPQSPRFPENPKKFINVHNLPLNTVLVLAPNH